jgi:hypothetical protein
MAVMGRNAHWPVQTLMRIIYISNSTRGTGGSG